MKNPIILALLFCLISAYQISAQTATLSIQGIMKNSDGSAVEDGEYELTFRLYENANDPAVWTEVQPGVEVKGGIYSALLGSVSGLPSFTQSSYLLGVSIEGGAELQPRSQVTAAPFALSLIGDDNIFPNSGNVGIGTSTPGQKLEVSGNAQVFEGSLTMKVAENDSTQRILFQNSGSSYAWQLLKDPIASTNNSDLVIAGGNLETNPDDLNERMRFTDDGDVEISAKINTKNNWISGDGGNEGIQIDNDGEVTISGTFHTNGQWLSGSSADDSGVFISSANRVGINTTPDTRFHVSGSSTFEKSSIAGNSNDWTVYLQNDNTSFIGGIRLTNSGFVDMSNTVNSGGTFARLASNGLWTATSDLRLKQDIEVAEPMLDRVMQLTPVRYHFKSMPDAKLELGLIAQEVNEYFPSLVNYDEYYTLNYSGLSVVAIGAIKEQQQIISEQAEKIQDLEQRLAKLESMMTISSTKK